MGSTVNWKIPLFAFLIISQLATVIWSQRLTEPHLLGEWTYGEDPSEFLLHRVLEPAAEYLKENQDGRLLVRICSTASFAPAFAKTSLNPLSIASLNRLRPMMPAERMFVSRSSNYVLKNGFTHNQYWFLPNSEEQPHEEVYSVEDFDYQTFVVDEEFIKDGAREFEKLVEEFIDSLKRDNKATGLIVHGSRNESLSRNIRKVISSTEQENIDRSRIVMVEKLNSSSTGEIDDRLFPILKTLKIKAQ